MKKTLFNDNFQCKILSYDSAYLDIACGMDPDGYKDTDIPHDALIGDAHSFYTDKVIWYRKKLGSVPDEGKHFILYFEGVYFDASIYINNQLVGKWVNGYTSFYFDITNYVNQPNDYLYVSIDYRCPNSRWYGGPGINRNVWLYESEEKHFMVDSLYICPVLKENDVWNVQISVETDNIPSTDDITVLFNCEELNIHEQLIPGEVPGRYCSSVEVSSPVLWDINNPKIYNCSAELMVNATLSDTADAAFGFRHIVMSPTEGMFLNGRHIKLNGVCLHSDQGCLGTAFYEEMARRQLVLMKEMGVNAIRLTHNVQAPAFLDLCDELGLLVLNEAFDCWKLSKTTYDYARFFEEWSERDIRSWVMRDRNHPSVFLWSAGNEIYDTHAGEEGAKTLHYITKQIKKHDFLGHAPVSLCSNYMAWENTIKAVDFLNFAGYNYGEFLYDEHHKAHPDWVIFGSETGSLVQSRGIYHFPLSKSLLVDDDELCSSLGNCCTSWGAETMDFCVTTERDNPYSLGQFLWAGIDYLGEPTPYHTKNSYFGIADTACFPKDVYYALQSAWRSFEECPMIHILPYWDFNEGQLIDVRICSNAPEVELFFNGKSLGRKTIDHTNGDSLYADYQLKYTPGTLRAVGYNATGEAVVSATEQSFGNTADFKLSLDSFDVETGDRKLRFVEIQAVDDSGNPVKNASDRVDVKLSGPARLIGMCNGNETDMDSFTGSSMRLFSGKLLAVIKPDGNSGHVTVNVTPSTGTVHARKLEICTDSSLELNPDNDTIHAHVNVMPANANNMAIEYQITNESGVPIKNAIIKNISEDGRDFEIQAVADADFYIRALCREEDGRVTIISQLGFSATGFGELFKNPYDFISGSLYDDCVSEIGNGNEKGVATSNIEDSYLLYQNMDFGAAGSKEVTIPIFELGGAAVPITFWCGMPHKEGSYIIGQAVYQKPTIWNVYQEETFHLDVPLKGIQDFGIEINKQKIHIKGFQFIPLNAAYETQELKNAEAIYGDQYTLTEDMITGIGNNVCITYKNMDFGADGATKIHIKGHTPLSQNTIHIRFNDGVSENRQIIEFPYSDDISEQIFELEPICGKGDLSFIFLPGSNFDFKEFTFANLHHPLQHGNQDPQ